VCTNEGKNPLERPTHRWDNNIKTDIKNRVGECGLNPFGLRCGLVVGCCVHDHYPSHSIKGGLFLDYMSDSFSRTVLRGVDTSFHLELSFFKVRSPPRILG
jgi:hypothetical protein